ncbi:hypothetical protein D9M69_539080 [compost metagenome]
MVHQLKHQLAAPDDDRDADQHAQADEDQVAAGSASHGKYVVQTHDSVGDDDRFDCREEARACPDFVGLFIFGQQQFHADPEQQRRTYQFQIRQGQ